MNRTRGFYAPNYFLSIAFVLLVFLSRQQLIAQQIGKKHIPGTTCDECKKNQLNYRNSNPKPQNGNASLGINYNNTACGLNYTAGSVVIQQRSTSAGLFNPPVGSVQPAPIVIAGIPACAVILKAFLYADASGNGVAINTTVKNPGGASGTYPMSIIGTDVDKCWSSLGYSATYSYRADVTPIVTGNGTYQVSGLPVYPAPGPNDVDGATLVIIYSDPSAGYTGTMVIADGAQTDATGAGLSGSVSGFNACGNSTTGNTFILLADLQQLAASNITINGSVNTLPAASDLWWNYVQTPTSVTSGQSSYAYSVTNGADCFNIVAIGLYYQTACNVCTASGLTVTASPASTCTGNTATAVVTGGSGAYSYTWSPSGGNSATTTNIPAGNYTVFVSDNAGCKTGTATVTVTNTGSPNLVVNSPTICVGNSTTLTVSGATNYTWSPATGLSSTSSATVTANPNVTTTYTVTGSTGPCIGTATSTVTVNPLPTILVNNANVCNGAAATLNASGASTYTWSPPTGLSSTTGASVTANPPSTTVYSVTGTDANGCVNTSSVSVNVSPNPNVSVTSGTICLGQQTATLTASGATTYAWSPATGLSSTTGTSVNANPATTTVYTITGTVGTCTSTGTATVTVKPLPTAVATSNSPVCKNQTINFTGSGGTGYLWLGPSSYNSVQQSPSIPNATAAMSGTYTLTVVDANNCTASTTTSVLVNPLPTVSVTSQTICVGGTKPLTASGALNYSWSPGTGLSSTTGATVNANPTSTSVYVVTGVDINTCVNTATSTVTVNPLPNVSVASITICSGSTGTLTASGANTYAWSPAAGLSSSIGTSVNVSVSTNSPYMVTGTDINGCVNTASLVVTVNPLPVLAVSPQTTSGCAPLCVSFSNTTAATGTCSWAFGDGTTSTSCTPNHCFTRQGTFGAVLTLKDNNGCVNTASASITVYPVPIADFNATPQPTTILEPDIHFTDATSAATISNWHWTFGDPNNSSSTQQNPYFVYLTTGSYQVWLTVVSNYGCRDSTVKIIKIDEDVMIYLPNAFSPNFDGTNDIFFAKGEGVKDFKLYVFDRWGNQVFYSDDIYKGWDGRVQGKGDIVQEDVYVWKVELKTFKGDARLLRGVVSLIK